MFGVVLVAVPFVAVIVNLLPATVDGVNVTCATPDASVLLDVEASEPAAGRPATTFFVHVITVPDATVLFQ